MEALRRVRTLGFRRWYERQLIESHAYFVTCFCCMILVVASLEVAPTQAAGGDRLATFFTAFAGLAGGIVSWRRYRVILGRAETIAEAAVCPSCTAYGAFKVTDDGPRDAADQPDEAADAWLRVRCRKCGHEWRIGRAASSADCRAPKNARTAARATWAPVAAKARSRETPSRTVARKRRRGVMGSSS